MNRDLFDPQWQSESDFVADKDCIIAAAVFQLLSIRILSRFNSLFGYIIYRVWIILRWRSVGIRQNRSFWSILLFRSSQHHPSQRSFQTKLFVQQSFYLQKKKKRLYGLLARYRSCFEKNAVSIYSYNFYFIHCTEESAIQIGVWMRIDLNSKIALNIVILIIF